MVLFGMTVVVVTLALISIKCTKRKLAPEVVNDVNPEIRFNNQNRFNPSITRLNILCTALLFMTVLFVVIVHADAPSLVETFSPVGLKINLLALESLLAMLIYPVSIYLTHEEAKKHLIGLIKLVFSMYDVPFSLNM